jgi:hypothetical protein
LYTNALANTQQTTGAAREKEKASRCSREAFSWV